jgi:hypothetical protein
MIGFFGKPAPRVPSPALRQALLDARRGTPAEIDALRVVERRGSYAGRRVTYFRAFDPAQAAARAVAVRAFGDLDPHAGLIVATGHTEHDRAVVLNLKA